MKRSVDLKTKMLPHSLVEFSVCIEEVIITQSEAVGNHKYRNNQRSNYGNFNRHNSSCNRGNFENYQTRNPQIQFQSRSNNFGSRGNYRGTNYRGLNNNKSNNNNRYNDRHEYNNTSYNRNHHSRGYYMSNSETGNTSTNVNSENNKSSFFRESRH